MMITIWICLITLASQLVHCKVVTINSTSGNTSRECCTKEGCMCGSLSTALHYINSNTIINITSKSVTLNNTTRMGSGKLTNITITGSNVTIMCNNSGSVYCESCDHVTIEGITWDRCGNPNGTNIAGVTFNGTNNISLVKSTFQHSQIQAVTFYGMLKNIYVNYCNFLSNKRTQFALQDSYGGLNISSTHKFVNVNVSNSYFFDNAYGFVCHYDRVSEPLYIPDASNNLWYVTITKTTFYSNMHAITIRTVGNSSVHLVELTCTNNTAANTAASTAAGIDLFLLGNITSLFLSNSLFDNNIGNAFWLYTTGYHHREILIINSNFSNNKNYDGSFIVGFKIFSNCAHVVIVNVGISHSITNGGGSMYFYSDGYYAEILFNRVNLISNMHLGETRAVYLQLFGATFQSSKVLVFNNCSFFNNTSGHVSAIAIDDNTYQRGSHINIHNSKFHHNVAGGIHCFQSFWQFYDINSCKFIKLHKQYW